MPNPVPDLAPNPDHLPGGYLAPYWQPDLKPLAAHIEEAVLRGPRPTELFPRVADAALLGDDGYDAVETGWTRSPTTGATIHCLTDMPGVTPAMWDWWFGWHGNRSERYKIWHPRAHLAVEWADGGDETGGYVGRTSLVTEYIGAQRRRFAIRFVPPSQFGFDPAILAARGQVAICARSGLQGSGLEAGTMVHLLRPTAAGCEMRSRFWILGENLQLGRNPGSLRHAMARGLTRLVLPKPEDIEALLVHCAEEMSHLASILPELHAEFGPKS